VLKSRPGMRGVKREAKGRIFRSAFHPITTTDSMGSRNLGRLRRP
jgi:hypothetical protein